MLNDIQTIRTSAIEIAPRLEDFYKDFITFCDTSLSTQQTYKRALKVFFDYLNANNISDPTREDLIAYKKDLDTKGLQATSQASYINAIKQFYKYLAYKGYRKNIAEHIKSVKLDNKAYKKDALTLEQAKQLKLNTFELAKNTPNHIELLRNFAIIDLLLNTGLRTIEVVRANISDIRLINGKYALMIQGKGKNDKTDFVLIPTQTLEILRNYLAKRENTNTLSPLFISHSDRNNGQRLTTRTISRVVKNAYREIGIDAPNLTAHSTRHTYATLLYKNNFALEDIQKALRHSSITTTMRYTHTLDKVNLNCEQTIANTLAI